MTAERRARLDEDEGAEFFRVSFARLPGGRVVWAHFDDEPEDGSLTGFPNGMHHISDRPGSFSAEPPKPPTLHECLEALGAHLGREVAPRVKRRRATARTARRRA